ncbi:MAG: hypothetical protein ACR2GU_04115, partial [Rubrobacteraceae bacterium]
NVADWERQFRDYIKDSNEGILDSIRDEKEMSDETEKDLREAIERFNDGYEHEQENMVNVSVGAGDEDSENDDENPENENQEES